MPQPEDNPDHASRSGLAAWAAHRDDLPRQRRELVAAAWRAGDRNVRALAEAADVARNTIYMDLEVLGLDRYTPIDTEKKES